MRLVLQCAMCGTHHTVGTPACSTCRASGVPQLRLMFECLACGGLGLNPTCAACPAVVPLDLDDDLMVAEEVVDDSEAHALDTAVAGGVSDLVIVLDDWGVEVESVIMDELDDELEMDLDDEGDGDAEEEDDE